MVGWPQAMQFNTAGSKCENNKIGWNTTKSSMSMF